IPVGNNPDGIAITPDGRTAWVANSGSNTVQPIDLATNTAGTPIAVGSSPRELNITPDGKTLYVPNNSSNKLTPIDLATRTVRPAVTVGSSPYYVSFVGAKSNVADLSVAATGSASSVAAGSPLTYSLTVSNAGPHWTTGTTVTDVLPANMTF